MARYLNTQLMRHPLVWLPLALYPLQPTSADLPNIAKGGSYLAATAPAAIFHVPRREAHEIPRALRSKDQEHQDKKHLFVQTVLPLVLMENERVEQTRERMLSLLSRLQRGHTLPSEDHQWLRELAKEYDIAGDPIVDTAAQHELRKRVDIIPVDLALAQAALETGWGRSRYVQTDRDLFGMTGFTPVQGRKPSRKGKGKRTRLPKFASLRDSVRIYIHTLNSHPAYNNLRAIRVKLREKEKPLRGISIAEGLGKYSVRGKAYIKAIRDMIRSHDLERYTLTTLEPVASRAKPA